MALHFDDIPRDQPEVAFEYLHEQAKEHGAVRAEEVGMLAKMQPHYPQSLDEFFDRLEQEGIEVQGGYL